MRIPTDTLLDLRWRLLGFVVAVAIGSIAAIVAGRSAGDAAAAHRQATVRGEDLRSRLSRLDAEAVDLQDMIDRYAAIVAAGHFGPERRRDWISRLARIEAARRLDGLHYELAPRQAMDAADAGGYQFMSSTIKLRWQPLHEDELLAVLDELGDGSGALSRVRDCRVERVAGTASLRLLAECRIDWISLREKP